MGIRQDTIVSLKDYEFTKIDGQPTDEDLNLLTEECINAASSIPTTNGGGQHGHIGMIIPEVKYIAFSHNAERFVEPAIPGPYPANVDQDAVVRERQIAEHTAEKAEFETHQGVKKFLITAITKAVDPEWIAKLKSERMGFNLRTPLELLARRRSRPFGRHRTNPRASKALGQRQGTSHIVCERRQDRASVSQSRSSS
jgi:hypothetical protein